MTQERKIADPAGTRFILWDPNKLKELIAGLYEHLTHHLRFYPNDDGVYQLACPHRKCPEHVTDCWDGFNAFFSHRGLDAEAIKELLWEDFGLYLVCQRDLIRRYRLEEVIREIDYQRLERFQEGEKNGNISNSENH